MSEKTTHFGFEEVSWSDKAKRVADVFHRVAPKYDLMNDLMSLGQHRLWKRRAISYARLRPGDVVLDLASGTGDIARLVAKEIGESGHVVITDINESMLSLGRKRCIDAGVLQNASFALVNGEQIPFPEDHFDVVFISFGLRNVTDKPACLAEVARVLKPGGRFIILEFSKPVLPLLAKAYDAYSFHIIPKLGELILKDRDSYEYLVESIRQHPDQDTLKEMMLSSGFQAVDVFNMNGGIVALHRGHVW